jgi:DNA invertase Pin-like site-specific DNA recombinase
MNNGIVGARQRGVRFGRKRELTAYRVEEIRTLREAGTTVPEIMRRTKLSKASVHRALKNAV